MRGQGLTLVSRCSWSSLRGRLHSLVSRVSERSLFRPAVLAVLCPDRTLSPDEASSLRNEAAQELQLSALESEGGKTAIWIARFDGAEGEFDAELRGLLDVAQVREERILRPMSSTSRLPFSVAGHQHC